MSSINIGKATETLDVSPSLQAFTGVTFNTKSNGKTYTGGTSSGRQLECDNPWATAQIANDVAAKISGFAYQPLKAGGAVVNPAAELGDGITVDGVSSRILDQQLNLGRRNLSEISAPADNEIDHEYPYQDHVEREVDRQKKENESSFSDVASGMGGLSNRLGDAEHDISVNAHDISVNASGIVSLNAKVLNIDTSLTTLTGALSVGSVIAANKAITAPSAIISDIRATDCAVSTLSVVNSLTFAGSSVSKTTLSGVTEFTQALGNSAPTTRITVLTTYASSETPWTVPAGTTITFSVD